VPVLLELLDGISSIRIYIPKDLMSFSARQSVAKSLNEVLKRFTDGPPLLDPIEDIRIEDVTFTKVIRHIESLEDKLKSPKFDIQDLGSSLELYKEKILIENEMKEIKAKIRSTDNIILQDNLKAMKRVLRRLGYLTKDNVVDVKGRVAGDVNTNESIVLMELLFSGFFTDLTTEQIVAVLSCFSFEGGDEESGIQLDGKSDLSNPYRQIKETARRVATVASESKVEINIEEYVKQFCPGLIEVLYSWCQGATFAEVCANTEIFEGTIIRAMRREEEVLRQMVTAAKMIGNTELENKFSEGIVKLKRGIVFAASLYL